MTNKLYFLFLLCWLSTIYLYTLLELNNLIYLKDLVLLFSSFLFIIIFLNPHKITFKTLLILFIFIKSTFLFFGLIDSSFLYHIMGNGDADHYHIPRVLSLNYDNVLEYIFDINHYANATGRLSHIIYAFIYNIFKPFFELCNINQNIAVMISSYVFNTVVLVFTSIYLYAILRDEKIDEKYIVYSISLILFSPFILTWSSYVLKETFYVSLIILTVISIIRGKKLMLLFVSIFFFIDRMYMLYFIILILLLSNKINKKMLYLVLLTLVVIFIFIFPVEKYIDMLTYMYDLNAAKSIGGDSLVANNSIYVNIERVLFTPFPLSAFKTSFIELNIFYREHFIVSILYTFFVIKILLTRNNNYWYLLFFTLLINLILFPSAGRQKITIIIPLISIIYPLYLHGKRHNLNLSKYWNI